SDTLHEKLMARFIDRRTSALMRGLRVEEELLAGVSRDGLVTVEGHFVGQLRGLRFDMAKSAGALEEKALRGAAQRAVAHEIARRLEAFVAAEAGRRLGSLRRLETALRDGRLTGLRRGLAYRLIEAGGVLDRREAEADLKALSQAERRALRTLGVRIGAFSLHL